MSDNFGDGTLDNTDREMVRHALSAYSMAERMTLSRFIGILISQPLLRRDEILRMYLHCLDEAPAKRRAGNLRLVDEDE